MKVTVVGAGAIGTLVAATFVRVGETVTVVARPGQVAEIAARGLVVEAGGSREVLHPHAVVGSLERGISPETDVVIVTVKAYDTEALARDLGRLPATPYVLTLQNGVGNEETLAAHTSAERVIAAALTTPVDVLAPGHVQVARASYKLGLAPMRPDTETWEITHALGERLQRGGFQVQYARDYRALKWTKLLMNITANAQAALLGWAPARVFAHPVAGTLEVLAWREALAVMRGLGVHPIAFGGYPLPLVTPLVQRLPVPVVRRLMGRFAAGGRGSKMPSVYLDLARGRGRTEVPWLNGAVARHGRNLGVPVPVNAALDRLVAAVASGALPWEEVHDRPERIRDEVQRFGTDGHQKG